MPGKRIAILVATGSGKITLRGFKKLSMLTMLTFASMKLKKMAY